jgi:hypothetical protein
VGRLCEAVDGMREDIEGMRDDMEGMRKDIHDVREDLNKEREERRKEIQLEREERRNNECEVKIALEQIKSDVKAIEKAQVASDVRLSKVENSMEELRSIVNAALNQLRGSQRILFVLGSVLGGLMLFGSKLAQVLGVFAAT